MNMFDGIKEVVNSQALGLWMLDLALLSIGWSLVGGRGKEGAMKE